MTAHLGKAIREGSRAERAHEGVEYMRGVIIANTGHSIRVHDFLFLFPFPILAAHVTVFTILFFLLLFGVRATLSAFGSHDKLLP